MFGRRKRKDEPQAEPVSAPNIVHPQFGVDRKLPQIVVQQSEFEAGGADLVYGVVRYVNLMMEDGKYRPSNMPAHAMQAYHSDLYLAQVNNGGHSQFIGNGGTFFQDTVNNALQGLMDMGAIVHGDILMRMCNWVMENQTEAAQQTGFNGGRAEYLEVLDNEFYAQEKTKSLSDINGDWIKSWSDLEVVPNENYKDVMVALFAQNPHTDLIETERDIRMLHHNLTDGLYMPINTVCWNAPNPCPMTEILPGSSLNINGEDCPAFPVITESGTCHAVLTKKVVGVWHAASDGLGEFIMKVDVKDIERLRKQALRYRAGAAVHLLLKTAGLPTNIDSIGIRLEDRIKTKSRIVIHIMTGKRVFLVSLGSFGANLNDTGGQKLGEITPAQIQAHAALAEL